MGEEKKKEGGEQRGKINERPTYKRERERENEREREKERERDRDRDRTNKRKNMIKLNQSKNKKYLPVWSPDQDWFFSLNYFIFIDSCHIEM